MEAPPTHLALLQNSVAPGPHIRVGLQRHEDGVGVIATGVGGVVRGRDNLI